MQETDEYWPAQARAREAEIAFLMRTIDVEALQNRATALRVGVECSIMVPKVESQNLMRWMGRHNFHLPILFENGVRWIARIKRQNVATPPASICEYLLRNEAATYCFLERPRYLFQWSMKWPWIHPILSMYPIFLWIWCLVSQSRILWVCRQSSCGR